MSTTTAPKVLTALTTGLAAALPGWAVGKYALFSAVGDDVVCVGFVPDGPSIEASEAVYDLGGHAQESYDVHSLASSRRPMVGSGVDFDTVEAQAFAVKDAVTAFLFADPSMGGLVVGAHLSAWNYKPDRTDQGVVADLAFTVHVQAFRS